MESWKSCDVPQVIDAYALLDCLRCLFKTSSCLNKDISLRLRGVKNEPPVTKDISVILSLVDQS